jgi:hypothetical protein
VAHVGGQLQAKFMVRVQGLDPARCLVVIVVAPFEFDLTETGFQALAVAISRSEAARSAEIVRVGVESAGRFGVNLRVPRLELFCTPGIRLTGPHQ